MSILMPVVTLENRFRFIRVPIELVTDCDGTGKIIATTISDSNGIYKFSGVPLGMYRVRVSEGAPGAPVHNPVPQDCCILIEDDQSTVAT